MDYVTGVKHGFKHLLYEYKNNIDLNYIDYIKNRLMKQTK